MRLIIVSTQYRKDLKLARKRGLPEDKLNEVLLMLANDVVLPVANRDHALSGDKNGIRECHILPNWLLLYSKEEGELQILNLIRTGTHSDLF